MNINVIMPESLPERIIVVKGSSIAYDTDSYFGASFEYPDID